MLKRGLCNRVNLVAGALLHKKEERYYILDTFIYIFIIHYCTCSLVMTCGQMNNKNKAG